MTDRYTGAPESRWYFWDGGFLAIGVSRGVVPPHSHHAYQMFVAAEGSARLQHSGGEWQEYEAAIVAADEPHSFNGSGTFGVMLLIDPESREGHWLRTSVKAPITPMLASRLPGTRTAIRAFWEEPPDAAGTTEFVDFIIQQFCFGPRPHHAIDDRVARAIELIQAMDTRVVSLEEIAGKVFLSPSRFAHLFSDEIGIPFRRYLLWRRLTRAILEVSRGQSLSRAAHTAGFTDSAHFTRTFYQMFGIPPSTMLNQGQMYEIPAPFELARAS